MIIQLWQLLEKNLTEIEGLYASSSTKDEVNKAEDDLKVRFARSYKKFLTMYGGANIEGFFIYGVKKQRSIDDNLWSVVQNTKFYKEVQRWPDIEDWYIISDDGRGNPIGCKPDGSVWLSDHDSNFEQVKLADSFEEFLYKLLTDTLYE